MKIRIENPTRGGARFTSPARAQLYVSQGCAELSEDGERLRFIKSHHRKRNAELSAQEMADQEHRLTGNGYDGRAGVLTLGAGSLQSGGFSLVPRENRMTAGPPWRPILAVVRAMRRQAEEIIERNWLHVIAVATKLHKVEGARARRDRVHTSRQGRSLKFRGAVPGALLLALPG